LEGSRRARRAGERGRGAAADLLARTTQREGRLILDDEPLTSERIRAAIHAEVTPRAPTADVIIVTRGAQSASGHEPGHGEILAREAVLIDYRPVDPVSKTSAD